MSFTCGCMTAGCAGQRCSAARREAFAAGCLLQIMQEAAHTSRSSKDHFPKSLMSVVPAMVLTREAHPLQCRPLLDQIRLAPWAPTAQGALLQSPTLAVLLPADLFINVNDN